MVRSDTQLVTMDSAAHPTQTAARGRPDTGQQGEGSQRGRRDRARESDAQRGETGDLG